MDPDTTIAKYTLANELTGIAACDEQLALAA